ncbi:LytTR family DNA-binding domain-containing protein [Pseudoalteromonas sp. APC 3893]|uniref:LytTR family DNA-binding domain-containing protein n=1 Tax=Pseudoalteromonas sp. APC 3893 TaxID=3035175 RepID=UPI0033B535AE
MSAYDNHGKHYLLTGNSLTELEAQLDPALFFRVNRSGVVNINYVLSFESYAKKTLAVNLQHMSEPLITSRTRTSGFRKWLAT